MRFAIQFYWALIVTLLFAPSFSTAAQQNKNEKIISRLSPKQLTKTLEKSQTDGFMPMDVIAQSNGRKVTFAVRLKRPERTIDWFAKFDIRDNEFEALHKEYEQKKYRLVVHEQYELKKKVQHACIWHFDETMQMLSQEEALDTSKRPSPNPVKKVWDTKTWIPADGIQGGPFAAMEKRVMEYIRVNQMPGVSSAIVINGNPVYQAAFGYSDFRRKKKLRVDQPLRTTALSCTITAVAVLKLAERGKLKLDQPVYKFLGEKAWKKAGFDERIHQITIEHLLHHSGGHDAEATLDPCASPRRIATEMGLKTPLKPKQLIAYMMSQPLTFDPGSRYSYSSYGYFLLARVIEKASGISYEEYIQNEIGKPLGLASMTLAKTDPDKCTDNEVRHLNRNGIYSSKLAGKNIGKWVPFNEGGIDFELLDGSHGWMTSPLDALKFTTALQSNPSPLISNQTKLVMVAKPNYVLNEPNGEKTDKWNAMGLRVSKAKNGLNFWMEGSAYCSSSSIVCWASGTSRCYIFSIERTASGKSPIRPFESIINLGVKEAEKLVK